MNKKLDGDILAKYDRLLVNVPMGEKIPKHIYQTYKTKDISDPKLKENIQHLKRTNPGWEYSLYDDADIEKFIQEEYGATIFSYYKRINPKYGAARADLFRYLLIYKYGGVYLDLKSTAKKPLDDVLLPQDKYLLSHWENLPGGIYDFRAGHYDAVDKYLPRGEYQQWHIIAVAGHPFLRSVILRVLYNIDHYHPWKDGVNFKGVIHTTGPVPYSLAIYHLMQAGAEGMYRIVESSEEDLGLKYSIYDGYMAHRTFIPAYSKVHEPIIQMRCMRFLTLVQLCIFVILVLRDKIKARFFTDSYE